MQDSVLPIYVKVQSDLNGLVEFERKMGSAADAAESKFRQNFSAIDRLIDETLGRNRTASGALDLGTGAIRENVRQLQARAAAAKEVAQATRLAAGGDRALVASSEAVAVEARNAARAEEARLQVLERVQAQLSRSSTSMVSAGLAARRSASDVGASRQAYLQLGQQLQDVAIQAQLGTNPLIILTQQGSQAAFALSGLGGTIGKVARFLAGPWGAAVFGAVTVLGLLIPKLFETKSAMEAAKVGSDGLSTAQGVLGEMFDLASGKIEKQNDLLRINARLTAANLRAESLKEKFDSEKTLGSAGKLSFMSQYFSGGPDKVGGPGNIRQQRESLDASAKYIKGIVSRVKGGSLKAEDALRITENFDFSPLGVTKEEFQQALVNSVSSVAKRETADAIDKTLDTGKLDSLFRKTQKGKRSKKGSDAAANKAARLQEFGEDAADKIARINDQFSDTPKAIERANQAMRTLKDLASDVKQKNPANAAEILGNIEKAKGVVEDYLVRPFQDYMKAARGAAAVDELRAQGREDEAMAMADILRLQEQMEPLSDKQKQDVLDTVRAERQRAAVIRDTQAIMQEYAQSILNVRSALEQTIGQALRGRISLSNILNSIGNSYLNLLSKSITERLFGDMFRDLEDQASGSDVLKRASGDMSASLYDGRTALLGFADAVTKVTEYVNGIPDPALKGIKDPGSLVDGAGNVLWKQEGDVVVNGRKSDVAGNRPMITPEKFVTGVLEGFIGKLGLRLPKTLGDSLQRAMQGAAYGQIGGGLVSALGGKSSGLGAGIGGAFGEAAFKKLAPKLFNKLGDFAGPLGSIAGGLLGGLVGGLLTKTKTGVATIGGTGGNLKVASITGNSTKFKDAAGGSASSAITTLEGIAEQLGGTLNAARGSVSIGVRNGKYRVDTTGQGITKTKKGAIDFGEDAVAAVKAATMDLIKDGVIEGLRASTQRLLQGGKDLEAAVAKAAKFESVFTRLKAYTDPVGAAIDTVDKEFRSLKRIFDEAGASAAEYASLEELYQRDRAKAVEEASSAMTSALKGLRDELATGDNGRSLRDRLSAALASYDPLATDLKAGRAIDYDKFAEASRTVLDLQRQIDGSQASYFARLDEITNLTAKALSDQQNVISIASGRPSALGAPTTNEPAYTPVVDALGNLSASLVSRLDAANQNSGAILQQLRSMGGGASFPAYSAPSKLF